LYGIFLPIPEEQEGFQTSWNNKNKRGNDTKNKNIIQQGRASMNLLTKPKCCIKYYPTIVIARLDRAIQKKKLDSPVKPENDNKELTFSEL